MDASKKKAIKAMRCSDSEDSARIGFVHALFDTTVNINYE